MPTNIEAQTTKGRTPQESQLGAHPVTLGSLAQRRTSLVSIRKNSNRD